MTLSIGAGRNLSTKSTKSTDSESVATLGLRGAHTNFDETPKDGRQVWRAQLKRS